MIPLSAVWAGPERDEHFERAAAALRQDRRLDPVPVLAPCRRCRPHAGRRPDRRRQVGAAGADGAAVPPLRRTPGLRLRFRRLDPRRGARHGRRLARSRRRAHRGRGRRPSRCSRSPASTMSPSAPGRPNGSSAILTRERRRRSRPRSRSISGRRLTSLASAPVAERTITGLSVLLQSNDLKRALQPYCVGGPYGRLLDAESERLGAAAVQAFETEGLIGTGAAPAVLAYLFHRIEDRARRPADAAHHRRGLAGARRRRALPASSANG